MCHLCIARRWRRYNARNRIVRDDVFAIKRSCWHNATHACYQVTDDGAACGPMYVDNRLILTARWLQRPNHVFSGLQRAVVNLSTFPAALQPVIVGGPNTKWPGSPEVLVGYGSKYLCSWIELKQQHYNKVPKRLKTGVPVMTDRRTDGDRDTKKNHLRET